MTPWDGAGCVWGPVRMKDASRVVSHHSLAGLVPSNSFLSSQPFPYGLSLYTLHFPDTVQQGVFLSLLHSKNNSGLELLQLQAAWELHPLLVRSPWK